MSRMSPTGRGRTSSRRRFGYRPRVELLDPRLPPGNGLGFLLTAADLEGPTHPDVPMALEAPELQSEGGLSAEVLARPRPGRRSAAATSVRLIGETDDASEGRDPLAQANTRGAEPFANGHAVRLRQSLAPALSAPSGITAVASFWTSEGNAPGTPIAPLGGSAGRLAPVPALGAEPPAPKALGEADRSQVLDNYGKLPFAFEENAGQTDGRVDFLARAGGATVFLTPAA
jgi:hypothetical protein